MKIVKKTSLTKEQAHGGQGARIVFASEVDSANSDFQAFTKGFLPAHRKFTWHNHQDIEEMMLVIKGEGVVQSHEEEYQYKTGDFFIFRANTEHEVENTSDNENEYIFVRIKTSR